MADNIDRGDDIVDTGDVSGDTEDQDKKVIEGEVTDKVIDKDPPEDGELSEEEKAAKELADAEALAEQEKKDKLQIPKARFDAAVKKAREQAENAERRAADAEAKLKAQAGEVNAEEIETALDKLDEELEAAITDGNTEKKAQIRREIRALNQQLSDGRAAVLASRATATAIEQVRYDALVNQMETEHPELNPDEDSTYDPEVVAEITEYKEAFEAKGLSSSDALRKALRAVYRGGKTPAQTPDANQTAAEKKAADLKKIADDRKAEAVAKGLKAKGQQSPDATKAGLDSDKGGKKATAADVAKMSNKDFDNLPIEELKKLRGD